MSRLPGAWVTAIVVFCTTAAGEDIWLRDDAAITAYVNQRPVTMFSVDTLLRHGRTQDTTLSRTRVLEDVIIHRVLAEAGLRRHGEAMLHPAKPVVFPRAVALEDQLVSLLRAVYGTDIEASVHALPGASLDGVILRTIDIDAQVLQALFGPENRLKLAYTLTQGQQDAARQTELLHYALPGGEKGAITLFDIYRRQNVQGRAEIHHRNTDFIRQQARLLLAHFYVIDWARKKFGRTAIDDLQRSLADRNTVHELMRVHGLIDSESESPLIRRLERQVSAREIAAYYLAHREQFRRIDRVKARHIRVTDEMLAHRIVAALEGGEDFATLARRHSEADDADDGGNLGWIVHEGEPDWVQQLALMQPVGQVTRPIRMPGAPDTSAQWEIMLVEQQELGYQKPDSEAVRYLATSAIAHAKAGRQFHALRSDAIRNATIAVNPLVLDEPLRLTGD
jgi:hypothetical protein